MKISGHVNPCGTMRQHLRHVHLSPVSLGGRLQLVDAGNDLVDRFSFKEVFHNALLLAAEPEGILAGYDSARIFRRSRLAYTRYCSL